LQLGIGGIPDAVLSALTGHRGLRVWSEMRRRLLQLVTACLVLGLRVALLLLAGLGSDGYSTLINGLSIAGGISFLLVNCAVGLLLIWLAWLRGLEPGPGTGSTCSPPESAPSTSTPPAIGRLRPARAAGRAATLG